MGANDLAEQLDSAINTVADLDKTITALKEALAVYERSPGAQLVVAERIRQIDEEGYEPSKDWDRAHELMQAGAAYARGAAWAHVGAGVHAQQPVTPWPWADEYWKPGSTVKRTLVKAAALILAAIDDIALHEELEDATTDLPAGN